MKKKEGFRPGGSWSGADWGWSILCDKFVEYILLSLFGPDLGMGTKLEKLAGINQALMILLIILDQEVAVWASLVAQ